MDAREARAEAKAKRKALMEAKREVEGELRKARGGRRKLGASTRGVRVRLKR